MSLEIITGTLYTNLISSLKINVPVYNQFCDNNCSLIINQNIKLQPNFMDKVFSLAIFRLSIDKNDPTRIK